MPSGWRPAVHLAIREARRATQGGGRADLLGSRSAPLTLAALWETGPTDAHHALLVRKFRWRNVASSNNKLDRNGIAPAGGRGIL